MNRKTLIAGAAFVGLAILAIVTMRQPEKGSDNSGKAPPPVAKLKDGDFDTLVISKSGGGASTTLVKQGTEYRVTAPVAYAADKDTAKQAFEAIENLELTNVVSDQKSRHDEFEVGGSSTRVQVKKGDKTLADLHIGKATGGSTLVRPEGRDDVWQANGSIKFTFDRDTTAWRDKSIVSFDENDARSIEVVAKDGSRIVLEKPQAKDGGTSDETWSVKETTVKVDPLDRAVPTGIINGLYSWKTNDFADNAKPEDTGLDKPDLKVTIGLKGAGGQPSASVLIGKKKGDDEYYVKAGDKPQVFLVKKYNLERIARRPIDFRDKTICNLSESEVTQVAVTRSSDPFVLDKAAAGKDKSAPSGNDAWKLSKPSGVTLDTSKVGGIVGAFKDWKANSFAEDNNPKTTGLAKPSATITAKSNVKGSGCVLRVGSETPDKQSYFVERAGTPEPYVVPKWSLDRVLVKLDDLKKK